MTLSSAPSIESIKKAMQTYARQGGTSNLFVNDDGLQLLPPGDRDERITYYETHGVGWVARPPHSEDSKKSKKKSAKGAQQQQEGFKRAGRFKKASNMNYSLNLSLRLERHLEALKEEREQRRLLGPAIATSNGVGAGGVDPAKTESEEGDSNNANVNGNHVASGSGSGSNHDSTTTSTRSGRSIILSPSSPSPRVAFGSTVNVNNINAPNGIVGANAQDEDLEDKALKLAIEEVISEAPIIADSTTVGMTTAADEEDLENGVAVSTDAKAAWRPWAANGKACRVGEIVLLVDSDTVVPEVCFIFSLTFP